MSSVVDTLAPPRLGAGFRWLLASSWISNLGDGIALAAGPLLVASQTDDPLLVALAALLQWLPQLLFALYAGALSDRLDRRTIVVTVDLLRAAILALIAASIVTDTVSIAVVLAGLFVLATAEVFADNASQTLLPMLVAPRRPRRRPTPGSRPGSSRSTSSSARRSARRCSRSAWPCRSSARRCSSRWARCW